MLAHVFLMFTFVMTIVIALIHRLNGEYVYGIRVAHLLANLIKDWLIPFWKCYILDLRLGYENAFAFPLISEGLFNSRMLSGILRETALSFLRNNFFA